MNSPTVPVRLSISPYYGWLHAPTLGVIDYFYQHRFRYKLERNHTEHLENRILELRHRGLHFNPKGRSLNVALTVLFTYTVVVFLQVIPS